jgi:glycosyltransferase involved in cell wall biosynthesis
MSFDLLARLLREPDIAVMHAHTMGRLGGIALTVARLRRLPFVMTIHGGFLDLPEKVQASFRESRGEGWEWGRLFGALLRARRVVDDADAVVTCNRKEAALLAERYHGKRIVVQPHGVPTSLFRKDHREAAREAFPAIRDRRLLIAVGRVDPVKNQRWLIEQAPELFQRHPQAMLILAGACTHHEYGESLKRDIQHLSLQDRVLLTGGLPPGDPRLIGLFQSAEAILLPSISETFGLVILEAWAAGTCVISSRTSGAIDLVRHGENGWLFDLHDAHTFHTAVDRTLLEPALKSRLAAVAGKLVSAEYDTTVLAGRIKNLYAELAEEKRCAT